MVFKSKHGEDPNLRNSNFSILSAVMLADQVKKAFINAVNLDNPKYLKSFNFYSENYSDLVYQSPFEIISNLSITFETPIDDGNETENQIFTKSSKKIYQKLSNFLIKLAFVRYQIATKTRQKSLNLDFWNPILMIVVFSNCSLVFFSFIDLSNF